MPTLNIPPRIRFTLYILAALGSVVVVYAMDKNWAGEAEFKCWTGIAGLLSLLAASKTTTTDEPEPPHVTPARVYPGLRPSDNPMGEDAPFGEPDELGAGELKQVAVIAFGVVAGIALFLVLSRLL